MGLFYAQIYRQMNKFKRVWHFLGLASPHTSPSQSFGGKHVSPMAARSLFNYQCYICSLQICFCSCHAPTENGGQWGGFITLLEILTPTQLNRGGWLWPVEQSNFIAIIMCAIQFRAGYVCLLPYFCQSPLPTPPVPSCQWGSHHFR